MYNDLHIERDVLALVPQQFELVNEPLFITIGKHRFSTYESNTS